MSSVIRFYHQNVSKIRIVGIFLLILCAIYYINSIGGIKLPVNDFTLYWSSSKLLLSGENPYNPNGLWLYQKQAANNDSSVVLMYYPPWTLLFTIPIGLFDREPGQLVWLLLSTTAIFICTDKLWYKISHSTRHRWIAWLLAFSFGPTFSALGYTGQITPIFLIGITGIFLLIEEPKKDWLTGLFLLLTAIKPQVPYLLLILLVLWAIHQRRYYLLISFISYLGAATALVMLFDSHIIIHFFQNFLYNTPIAWATPTIGTYLRYYFGVNGIWALFIPAIIFGTIAIYYWWHYRNNWDWKTALPWIILLSVISSPYTWTYDFVILILPMLISFSQLLGSVQKWYAIILAGFYIILNSTYWWLHLKYTDFYFIWFAPALFIWYIMVQAANKRKHSSA